MISPVSRLTATTTAAGVRRCKTLPPTQRPGSPGTRKVSRVKSSTSFAGTPRAAAPKATIRASASDSSIGSALSAASPGAAAGLGGSNADGLGRGRAAASL